MADGNLPGDITEDILSRLSVKSLIRSAAVCKSWYSLISSSDFIQFHLFRSSVNPQNHYLLLHRPCRDTVTITPLNFSAIPSISTSPIPVVQTSIAPVKSEGVSRSSVQPICGGGTVKVNRSFLDWLLVGSINGLVCFSSPRFLPTNVVIWNPATRKFKYISIPHLNLSNLFRIHVAFAFDLLVNDYKIVCIYEFRSTVNVDLSFCFFIYSCNADSWKEIKPDFPFLVGLKSECVTVKGNPYWMGLTKENEIWLSVNVQTEVIRLFTRPEYAKNMATMTSPLNLNDSVAQIVRSPGRLANDLIDVYTMDENSGVWSKMYTLGSTPLRAPLFLQCYKNEFVIKDGERKLFTYDPISKEIKDLGVGEGKPYMYMAINYSESLVAIGGMQCIGGGAGEEDAPGTSHR